MDAKLTFELDESAIEGAKEYAARRGMSLSQLVENYFRQLTEAERTSAEKPTGVVAELAGVLNGAEIGDSREEYAEYLERKYF